MAKALEQSATGGQSGHPCGRNKCLAVRRRN